MLVWLRAAFFKRWLRNRRIKFPLTYEKLPKDATLIIEEGVSVGNLKVMISHLSIGSMSYIRSGGELINVSSIGRYCSIGNGVILGQERAGHPLNWVSSHPFQYTGTGLNYENLGPPATIGHDVWIGRDAIIMEGVRVGIGAVIAARSVVTNDVPDYAIVAGVPARIIRYRHKKEIINALLDSEWWDIPLNELKKMDLSQPEIFIKYISLSKVRKSARPICVKLTKNSYIDFCAGRSSE